MRELKLFLKYGLFLQTSSRKKKARATRRTTLLVQIFIFVYFLGFTVFIMDMNFSRLAGSTVGGVDFLELTALYWMVFAGGFFVIGTIGTAVYVLSMNEEIEFLLSLPLRRWTITVYQIFISFIYDLPMFGMLVAVAVAYGYAKGGVPFAIWAAVSSVFHTLFLLALGVYLATFAAKRISTSVARRIFILVQSLAVIGFVFTMNAYLENASGFEEVFKRLSNLYGLLRSPLNVLGYSITGADNPAYILFSLALAALFGYLFIREAKTLGFSVFRKSRGKVQFSRMGKGMAIIVKDLKTIFRAENSLFLLLYPYIFGAFMGWSSKEPVYALLVAIPISSLYVMMESSIATTPDLIAWQVTRAAPLKFREIVLGKVFTPVIINFLLAVGVVLFSTIFKGFSWLAFPLLGIALFEHIAASLMGVEYIFAHPPRSENVTRESMKASPWLTFSIMGLAGGAIFGLAVKEKWWGLLILIGSLSLTAFFIFKSIKGVRKKYEELMKGMA